LIGLLGSAVSQYEPGYDTGYDSGSCGPNAAYGGAYWPSLSAEHPCGVNFWSEEVMANAKCQLQLLYGASYFLSLGGVFVTSPASDYNANTFYFHTYDNWQGQMGASVVNFWQNADFPSNSSCWDADSICITCTPEPDADYDGSPDTVQGVYLGNFMHDFRHEAPSQTNVPIANSNGHINGTVYEIELYDQYGMPVPITNIASHYGHDISSPYYEDGTYYADDGKFALHVGCTNFEGQFLYFSFSHQGDMEANGWYSYVTASYEYLDCPDPAAVVNWESAESEVAPSETAEAGAESYGSSENPYAAPAEEEGTREASQASNNRPERPNRPNRPSKGNRPNKDKQRTDYYSDYYDDGTNYYENVTATDDSGAYDYYQYRK